MTVLYRARVNPGIYSIAIMSEGGLCYEPDSWMAPHGGWVTVSVDYDPEPAPTKTKDPSGYTSSELFDKLRKWFLRKES